MTPHDRILVLVGGAAISASLAIAAVFIGTNAAGAALATEETAGHSVQLLGDQLLTSVRDQREALNEYLLSADPGRLARYRSVVADGAEADRRLGNAIATLSDSGSTELLDAVARVSSANDDWRATVADPAIAAVRSGSAAAIQVSIRSAILEGAATDVATSQLVARIDAMEADLADRSDALSALRLAAAAFGVVIELLAAGLSLWFVRRYGLTVSRDSRRRVQANAERVQIVASLRTLRAQQDPEATAAIVASALTLLPGVDVAGVIEFTADGLIALAVRGLPGFPVQSGQALPDGRARYLRERAEGGPWADMNDAASGMSPYGDRLVALGIKSQAFAPIRADGELVGLIAVATTDAGHGRHLVEDMPAVGEFASVAETILAPALVARRRLMEKRRRIGATIAAAAFRPVFQPIVDLAAGVIVGYEALTRFDDGTRPDLAFTAARECEMGIDLETVTLEAAVHEARDLPPGGWLSLNVSPALLAQEGSLARILADPPGGIVLEVTEHEAIESYAPLRATMLALGPGVRLAVDDVGAGVANFNHLVELRPTFVKIDASLVRGVDRDAGRRAVVVGLIHFAAEAGCQVIAEGIETEAERATVRDLGVALGQGFLLARPAPAQTWSIAPPSVKASTSAAAISKRRGHRSPVVVAGSAVVPGAVALVH